MTAEILDGIKLREAIMEELRAEIAMMRDQHNMTPGLVTILVGDNPASQSYVALKIKTALSLGFHEVQESLPETTSQTELLALIDKYNNDPAIHGILVQLPLPPHIKENKILLAIDPKKDVDGFHPSGLGLMLMGETTFLPCTPRGIQEILLRSGVELAGAEVVIIGRSNIVGRPLSIMLSHYGMGGEATVTVLHRKSRNIAEHCARADILIVAAGMPGLVKAEWIKPGATVIDVGVNRVGANPQTGKAILRGDVDFENAVKRAGRITPVPGGVGPMTIAMLMQNTVNAAWAFLKKPLPPATG
jgi:methylenetetrahydrofolate dehydrogenase (NADP+)/methenyltetrahydrofolate cyclohydrolase